jgi:hypothetical protein
MILPVSPDERLQPKEVLEASVSYQQRKFPPRENSGESMAQQPFWKHFNWD